MMKIIEAKEDTEKKLVQNEVFASLVKASQQQRTKKHARKRLEPRFKVKKIKDRTYLSIILPDGRDIYIGSPDYVLRLKTQEPVDKGG